MGINLIKYSIETSINILIINIWIIYIPIVIYHYSIGVIYCIDLIFYILYFVQSFTSQSVFYTLEQYVNLKQLHFKYQQRMWPVVSAPRQHILDLQSFQSKSSEILKSSYADFWDFKLSQTFNEHTSLISCTFLTHRSTVFFNALSLEHNKKQNKREQQNLNRLFFGAYSKQDLRCYLHASITKQKPRISNKAFLFP